MRVDEGKKGKDVARTENRRRTDRETDACLFFASRRAVRLTLSAMNKWHRTQMTLPTHAMHTADIDGEAL